MHREILPVSIILLMFAIAFYASPIVQANNGGQTIDYISLNGVPNGSLIKILSIYVIPVLAVMLYLAFLVIPKIKVYKKNADEFNQQLWGFRVVLIFVMGAIYVAMLLPHLGYWGVFDPSIIIASALALLFFYLGYLLNFNHNAFVIGIRTKWAEDEDKIWEKTNKLAGQLFWICSALIFVSLVAPSDARLWLIVAPVILVAIAVSAYSMYEYLQICKKHNTKTNKIKLKKKGKKR